MQHIKLDDLPTTELFRAYLADQASVFPNATPTIAADKTPSVVSGQQIGLLGGPLYTLLKIRMARVIADERSATLNRKVDAVFWLEDNDHDAAEASTVALPKEDGHIEHITMWDGSDPRLPVSQRTFSKSDIHTIEGLIERLDGRFSDDVKTVLRSAYTKQRSWSDAFLNVVHPFLDAWNVRVVKGSEVIASAEHAWLVKLDLQENGALERIVSETTGRLVARGFHAQATVPDFLFFYHDEHGRHKVIREGADFRINGILKTKEELLETLNLKPQTFSPSVLARPLVQDKFTHNIASVLGAAELAYHAQLTDLYTHVGMQQPECVSRHMACLLDQRTERLLEKSGKPVQWFFRRWEEIEHETVDVLATQLAVPTSDSAHVHDTIAPFRNAAERIDPTLIKTAEAAGASIRATIEALEGKLRAAVKRTGNQVLERLHNIWWHVYPDAVLSERVYPLSLWMARFGADALRIIVERICTQSRTTLTIIGMSDIENQDNNVD